MDKLIVTCRGISKLIGAKNDVWHHVALLPTCAASCPPFRQQGSPSIAPIASTLLAAWNMSQANALSPIFRLVRSSLAA